MAENCGGRQLDAVTPELPFGAVDGSTTASSDAPTVAYEIDLLLTPNEAKLLEKFRHDIRLCQTDLERYDKCLQKRDELLEENDRLVLRLAAFEHVMSRECVWYRERKERVRQPARLPRMTQEDGAAKWERFVGVVAVGSDTIPKLLPPLKVVSLRWGKDVVQHYQLASKGQNYCNKFSAAAKLHNRENGIRKLNRLLLRRFQIPGRRDIKTGLNPIEPVDLHNLANWTDEGPFVKEGDPDKIQLPFADLTREDLPGGFIFDQFGLMVRCPSEPSGGAGLADLDLHVGEKIVHAVPMGEEAGVLSTGGMEDANSTTRLASTTSPGHSRESTPPTSPGVDSPSDTPSPAVEGPSRSVVQGVADTLGDGNPDDNRPENTSLPWFLRSQRSLGPGNADGRTATRHYNDADQDVHTAATRQLRQRQENPGYYEAPSRSSKPGNRQLRPLSSVNPRKERCCPPEIPPTSLAILDNLDARAVRRMLSAFSPTPPFQDMCHPHLKKFTEVMAKATWLPNAEKRRQMSSSPERNFNLQRRRVSLPDLAGNATPKRLRLDDSVHSALPATPRQGCYSRHTPVRDEAYRRQALDELQFAEHELDSWGRRTSELISRIVQKSKPPTDKEAYFLRGEAAAKKVEFGQVDAPIFTQDQQPFQWKGEDRPISQFFCLLEDLGLDRTVSVQIPSRSLPAESCEEKTLLEARDRFLQQRPTNDPWNLPDLQSPVPSTLPSFLEGQNCQLLLRVRDAILMGSSAERIAAPGHDWNTWRNVLDWALLSEGGHSTAPHMDSHGYSTWITAQEGRIGFGWMSYPTQQEEDAWMSNPHDYTGGDWRYVVLLPGQTVFFPSGTIYFVFRMRGEQTFALGGHILQWSGIGRWLQVVIAQRKSPDITNEDIEPSASAYVHVIKGLLSNRIRAGRDEEVGGRDAIVRFFALLEVSLLPCLQGRANNS